MRRSCLVVLVLLVPLAGCASLPVGTNSNPGPATATPTDVSPGTGTATATAAGTPVASPTPAEADLTVTVVRVVDGDTLKVAYENGTEDTVRLIGVDTPEVHADNTPKEFEGVPNNESGRDCLRKWGHRASNYTKQLEGQTVQLAYDENLDHRGYYGRLLAYVLVDGTTHNYRLVKNGYARVYDSQFTRKEAYYDAEARAQRVPTGLWHCATGSTVTATATSSGGTSSALAIATVHADAEGHDGENLNDEYVVLENRGETSVNVTGWTVSDAAGHTYTFGQRTIPAGGSVTLHTGSGTDTDTDAYWGQDGPVWNNDGDTVTVRAANGSVVVERTY